MKESKLPYRRSKIAGHPAIILVYISIQQMADRKPPPIAIFSVKMMRITKQAENYAKLIKTIRAVRDFLRMMK